MMIRRNATLAEPQTAIVELPLVDEVVLGSGYVSRRLDLRMTRKQAMALKRIFLGLQASGETLDDGNWIRNQSDVFRYILDRATR